MQNAVPTSDCEACQQPTKRGIDALCDPAPYYPDKHGRHHKDKIKSGQDDLTDGSTSDDRTQPIRTWCVGRDFGDTVDGRKKQPLGGCVGHGIATKPHLHGVECKDAHGNDTTPGMMHHPCCHAYAPHTEYPS